MVLQVELLEQSFAEIKPQADNFVNSFYENLFTAYPEAKQLFAKTNMAEPKKKLLDFLVLVVDNLQIPEVLENSLRGLGATYLKYGSLPEHYPFMGNALLTTLEQYLGYKWTPEVKQAWMDAYGVISEILLDGADYSQEEIALDAPLKTKEKTQTVNKDSDSAEVTLDSATSINLSAQNTGDESSRKEETQTVNKDSDPVEVTLDVELLESSFAKIKPRLSSFAASFYQVLFVLYPETKPLFANTDIKAQEQKLAESLVLVVINLRKLGFLTQALKDLGNRHIQYGILPEHYPPVGDAILTTFRYYLGSDWTPEVKKAWTDAYNLLSNIMLEGADSEKSNVMALNWSTANKSAGESVVGRKSYNSPRKVTKSINLSAQTTGDQSSRKEVTQTANKDSDYSEVPLNIELLESSFAQIRPRLSKFSESFYRNLFTIYPEIKPLFANIDMKAQEEKLVDSLMLVILNLRQPSLWTQALRDLGTRHIQYGTFAEHYPLVGNILLTTFNYYLGPDWTPEVKQAWKDAYNLISKIMLEGADSEKSNVIGVNGSTVSKYAEKSVVAPENDNYSREVNTSPNLSAQADKNEFLGDLLAGILAVGGLILLVFILL